VTESDWLSCSDPDAMLSFLASRGPHDERRLRLVACACVRQAWHLLTLRGRVAVEVAESFAEGAASGRDLGEAQRAMSRQGNAGLSPSMLYAYLAAWDAGAYPLDRDWATDTLGNARKALQFEATEREARRAQARVNASNSTSC
jgi:hypothetical protein